MSEQIGTVKFPLVEQVASPLPVYPKLHVTETDCPVVPVMEPEAALFELATCTLVQLFARKQTNFIAENLTHKRSDLYE
jgi:hypothetical protein